MDGKEFFKSWEGTQIANRYSGLVILLLSIALVVIAFVTATQANIVTVVPANFSEELTIEQRNASRSFKESWGLYYATLVGNTTPRNIEFMAEHLGRSMSPGLYRRMNAGLRADVEKLKSEGVTTAFTASAVVYEPATDKVFVTGKQDTIGRDGVVEPQNRTYEMIVEVSNYQAVLTHFDVYDGGAKTLDNIRRN